MSEATTTVLAPRERWLKTAPRRTEKAINALEALARCGNRTLYEFEPAEVEQVNDAINGATDKLREAFLTATKLEKKAFRFKEAE